jgi:hypothetical protein
MILTGPFHWPAGMLRGIARPASETFRNKNPPSILLKSQTKGPHHRDLRTPCAAMTPATWMKRRASARAFNRALDSAQIAASGRAMFDSRMDFSVCTQPPVRWQRRSANKPSGRERFGFRIPEKRYRLELVVAGPAVPEIGRAMRAALNPLRGGDRLAALGAGISLGQIAEIYSGHGVSPLLLFCFF